MPEYIFTIRSGDQLLEAERAVALDSDEAALDYACELVRHLRRRGGYDDPNLVVMVRDEHGGLIFSIPFLAASA